MNVSSSGKTLIKEYENIDGNPNLTGIATAQTNYNYGEA